MAGADTYSGVSAAAEIASSLAADAMSSAASSVSSAGPDTAGVRAAQVGCVSDYYRHVASSSQDKDVDLTTFLGQIIDQTPEMTMFQQLKMLYQLQSMMQQHGCTRFVDNVDSRLQLSG